MRMSLGPAALVGLALLASETTSQSIVNGDLNGVADFQSFNGVTPSGWTIANGSTDLFNATTAHAQLTWQASAGGGTFVSGIGSAGYAEAFTQVLTGLSVGTTYEIQFEQSCSFCAFGPADGGFWRVTFGSAVQDSSPMTLPPSGVPFAWQPQSMLFVATATSQALTFEAQAMSTPPNPFPAYIGIDSVQIAPDCSGAPGFEIVSLGIPPNTFRRRLGFSSPK